MKSDAGSLPITVLVSRRIAVERYGDFLAWMREGEILAAGFPGFLGSGVLQPPRGGDLYEIVMRFDSQNSYARWHESLPRKMWLERGQVLVREAWERGTHGDDNWFNVPSPAGRVQRLAAKLAYCLAFAFFFCWLAAEVTDTSAQLRVLLAILMVSPVLVYRFVARVAPSRHKRPALAWYSRV